MSGLRILVIDDHQDAAVGLRQLLELDGHRVRLAHDGPSGLESLGEEQFDVVLCDLGLPGMDGFEVARRIRGRPEGAELPLFALTGYGDSESASRAEEAGFDRHLVKPLDVDQLARILGEL